jgi:L-lactate permease
MALSALIPFTILLIAFAGLRLPLTYSSFISLLATTLLSQTLFHATPEVWNLALEKTLQMMVEIGLILVGAFFFLEAAKKSGVIDSLARLIRSISPDRAIQAVLVTFPLSLMVEGSSGFGTPLLVIAPILLALEFKIELCALLPFVSFIVGIPYGALGTPTRLGFPGANPTEGTFLVLAPFIFLTPILTLILVAGRPSLKLLAWSFSLSLVYFFSGHEFARVGPELAALGPAFFTFVFGIASARTAFRSKNVPASLELKGLGVYGLLLLSMWIGKQLLMDEKIPGTMIRIFNPGYVFLVFGSILILSNRSLSMSSVAKESLARSKRTLLVLFCMTFIVQQLRANGSLELLTRSIPPVLLSEGSPLLGWIGSILIGTSTMANLLLSKVVDPIQYVPIAAGSAIGVQLAFQSVVAMKSILHDRLSEKRIFLLIAPLSLSCILLLWLNLRLFFIFGFDPR